MQVAKAFLSALLFFVCNSAFLDAQTLPLKVLPKNARALLNDYVLIPSGGFTKNLFTGHDSLQFLFPKQVFVDSFYMGRFEVTVEEYLRFYQETDDVRNKYDSAVWTKDFPYAYNEPMTKNYFRLLHYRKYPVVGVTWEQAMRFCRWKSEALNALLENTAYAVECTLPTDAEWQYAACGPDLQDKEDPGAKQRFFPWGVFFLAPHLSKGEYQLQCNSGNAITPQGLPLLSYASDGGLYTLPVEHFEPNGYGLYQMSGNVAEWTSDNYSVDYTTIEDAQQKYKDKPEMLQRFTPVFPAGTYDDYKIVKGGSWADSPFYMQIGVSKIQHPEKASSMVGFRPVVRIYRK